MKIFSIFILAILFFGCAQRQYFEPLSVNGNMRLSKYIGSQIVSSSREGAVLENKKVIVANSPSMVSLKDGETFLSKSGSVVLSSRECRDIIVQNGGVRTEIPVPSCPVSASISGNLLAVVLANNSSLLYDITNKNELFNKKLDSVVAINSLVQSPIFFGNKIFYPMLDGNVLVIDKKTFKLEKSISVNIAKFFNNVFFLKASDNLIYMATPKRVMSIVGNDNYIYDMDIRDIAYFDNKLYVATSNGEIVELDGTLRVLRSAKFEFAQLSALVFSKNRLYTIDVGSGYIIEIDLKDFSVRTYKSNIESDKSIFYFANKIYNGNFYREF